MGLCPKPRGLTLWFPGSDRCRAAAFRRKEQSLRITPRKPGRALRSILTVALSSMLVKQFHYTTEHPAFALAPLKIVLDTGYTLNINLLRHSKYQLLIQRLVLFFYPMAAQKPLWQRVFRHFLENVSRYNHHSDHVNRRGRQNHFPRLYFLPRCGQKVVFLSFVKSFTAS